MSSMSLSFNQLLSGVLLQATLTATPILVFHYYQLMQKRSDISKLQDSFIIVFSKDKQSLNPHLIYQPKIMQNFQRF